ncbi:MAG: hypothetical protein ABSE59_08105, partial [Opitutaceae bacterium]
MDAFVVLDGDQAKGLAAAVDGLPSLVMGERAGAPQVLVPGDVRFGAAAVLAACLHNQTMLREESHRPSILSVQPGDEV